MITHFTRKMRRGMEARLGALWRTAFRRGEAETKEKEEMSAIYKAGDKEYRISREDRLELARMLVGETGSRYSDEELQALLWAIMNRFMLSPRQRERSTLKDLLQAFSQPINPRWDGIPDNQKGQDFCAPGGEYEDTWHCTTEKLRRRIKTANLSWDEIPKRIRKAVLAFEKGELPYPKAAGSQRLTNWASYPGVRQKFPWGVDIGGNWFFEEKGTLNLAMTVGKEVLSPSPTTVVGVAIAVTGFTLLGLQLGKMV